MVAEQDIAGLVEELTNDVGNDTLRLIFADALEDDGDCKRANEQRRIASMRLGLYDCLTGSDESNIIYAWLDYEGANRASVVVKVEFDEDLLVYTYTVSDDHYGETYILCTSQGDLMLTALVKEVRS